MDGFSNRRYGQVMLTEKTQQAIIDLQTKYPQKRSALIPALHMAQAEIGYLPTELQEEVAKLFDLETSEVHAVVTFYDMFYEKPVGKHIIHVCKNVSCMLQGCDKILEALCRRLQVKPGETTSDGEFTVIASECLAACDKAPMMLVDDKVVGPITENDIENILNEAKQGHGHPSPIAIQEVTHA
jgi:NADH-quinone oxidoreductase subunit E